MRARSVSAVVLFACGLVISQASAAMDPAVVAQGSYPDLAVDQGGDVHLVYERSGALYYRKLTVAQGSWSNEQSTGLLSGMVNRSDPEVVIDSAGRPHVLVGSSYAYFDGAGWISIDPGVTRDTAMAIDSGDNVYICQRGGQNGGYLGLRVRLAGQSVFSALPDPDISNGLPLGPNNHVYGHVFVNPTDDSVHVVYRHAVPLAFGYRGSNDAGANWFGGGVSADDSEGPSGAAADDGTIYVVSGDGTTYLRTGTPSQWNSLGRAVTAVSRDLPALAVDDSGNLYVSSFGGRYNVRNGGNWIGEQNLPQLAGQPLGFAEVAAGPGPFVYVVWEEGASVNNDLIAGTSDIVFATIDAQGNVGSGGPPGTTTIGQWDRFEASVTNTQSYSDPYNDVTLNVTYTAPDGNTIAFWGFYAGGTTWKIRFSPDQLGTWSYSATFSDGQPGTSGTFGCVPSNIPGRISEDETNPIWFGYQGGNHELVRSLHVGDRFFAKNWDDPADSADGNARPAFLDWAQAQGYNMLSVASHYLNREASGRGLGWDTPDLWPLDAAEYQFLESMLDDLATRRILVYPFAGFFGQSSDFPTDETEQERYIRYTLARLGPYWNVLFNVAGPEPLRVPGKFQDAMGASDINRLGNLIDSLDVFGHLLSVHNEKGDTPFKNETWLSYVTLQGSKDKDLSSINAGMLNAHTGTKPIYAQEVFWPGNTYHASFTTDEIRKKGFVLMMSAAAINFADMDGNSSSGFSGTIDLSQRVQTRHDEMKKVWDFFETVPFYTMDPRQDLVSTGSCLADPGTEYLVYLASGDSVNVSVVAGTYTVEWINAQDVSEVQPGGTSSDGQNLTAPDNQDWILRLQKSTGCVTVADCPTTVGECTEYACISQQCIPQDVAQGTACNEDGDLCTIDECDGAGQCLPVSNVACNGPLGQCDSGEVCNPGTGSCELISDAPAGTSCNEDGDLCTTDECDGLGSCVTVGSLSCDDGNVCTDDVCDAALGCVATPNADPCDDGLTCTIGDTCSDGACAGLDTCPAGEVCSPSTAVCEPASLYDLLVSTSSDRSNPVPLSGAVVTGNIYVFTSPDVDVGAVCFFFEGSLNRCESNPPFDYEGGSNSTANPWTTSSVPDGTYTISAELELLGGGVDTVSATFTVGTLPAAPPSAPAGLEVN